MVKLTPQAAEAVKSIGGHPALEPFVGYLRELLEEARDVCEVNTDADEVRRAQGEARAYRWLIETIEESKNA